MADVAPERLRRFVYYLTRDFIPVGAVEHALHRAETETYPLPQGTHLDLADELARRIAADV